MKVLFATTNPAKIKKYKDRLEARGIELITLKDLNLDLKVDETGKNALENSYIKAKAYYEQCKMTTIGMDNCLYIEELPEEKQPGTYVRRVNGKELNDEGMIEYYSNLVKENGGKLTAKWVYGMTLYNDKGQKQYTWSKENFYLIDKTCSKRTQGYPLDSISIAPKYNKYFVELSKEEKTDKENDNADNGVIEFIIKSINNLK